MIKCVFIDDGDTKYLATELVKHDVNAGVNAILEVIRPTVENYIMGDIDDEISLTFTTKAMTREEIDNLPDAY